MSDLFGDLGNFGALINALGGNPGGDAGSVFPASDAEDFRKGATQIPGQVTDLRREGRTVTFVQPDRSISSTWYWQLPNGSRIEHP